MAGGWLRSSAIYDSFYGEIGLETLGTLDGDGWGTRVSELFLADRIGATSASVRVSGPRSPWRSSSPATAAGSG